MKGIYLGAYKAHHDSYDIDYQDINGLRDIGGDMLTVDLDKYDFIIATHHVTGGVEPITAVRQVSTLLEPNYYSLASYSNLLLLISHSLWRMFLILNNFMNMD